MKYKHIQKDYIKRLRIRKTETQHLAFKVLRSHNWNISMRDSSLNIWYPKATQILRPHYNYKARCILTGRAKGVCSLHFKISRLMIRELASKGLLSGLKKASW